MRPVKQWTMKQGLYDVWQAIGCDVLQGGGDVMTGEEVAAVVVDYVETYIPQPLLIEWKAASYEQKHKWLDEAFPKADLYGF